MESPTKFVEQHFENIVESLKTLTRIPSVSAKGFSKETVRESAQAVAAHFKEYGLENVEVIDLGDAHPYIYGDWLHAEGKPTLLLYAHHDVQPPGREKFWKTPPFEPTQIGDRLFARGIADDKAGILVHTGAIQAYLKTVGRLPVNVKVIVEGEEEIGSAHLEKFLTKYKKKLAADVMILTDTQNFDVGIPAITTSLRGVVGVEVEVKVMDHPLHSGSWGGPIPDPVIALSKMIATLVDNEGRICIPGIYDKVRKLSPSELASLEKLNYTESDFRKQAGLLKETKIFGGERSLLAKLWREPTLGVTAIQASSRELVSNIINDSAWCKVSIRTVPDMDNKEVLEKLKSHLLKQAPWGVTVHFDVEQTGGWWVTTPEGPAFEKAKASFTKAYGKECVFIGLGGSIPFVEPFARVLGGIPALLIGIEDPYTNAHSENESLYLPDFKRAILGSVDLYQSLAQDI